MRILATALVLLGIATTPLLAQGRQRSQGIPPGKLPPAGLCRVWYDNVPPGHQPAATSCREAERIAARDRRARVIYGDTRGNGTWRTQRDDQWGQRDDRSGRSQDRLRYGVPYDNGYEDGFDKGLADTRDRDRYDPARHREYRNGDRGYNSRYGSKDEYRNAYREGFRSGYDEAYRTSGQNNRPMQRWPS